MGMGIVSDSDFESESKNLNINKGAKPPFIRPVQKIHTPEIVNEKEKGRGKGNVEVPNSLRNLIGQSAVTDRSEARELAHNFGISDSSVSAYSNGSTSTASYNDQPNAPIINKVKERITKKARIKMMMAMNHITESKLAEAKPRDLAGIAKDMGSVIKSMEPDKPDQNPGKQGPAFVVYSPQFHQEKNYEVIVVKE